MDEEHQNPALRDISLCDVDEIVTLYILGETAWFDWKWYDGVILFMLWFLRWWTEAY